MAKKGEKSRFGKRMAKTQKIINIVMVVDAWAQGMSLWNSCLGRLNDCSDTTPCMQTLKL
jgi:hypothetical protein